MPAVTRAIKQRLRSALCHKLRLQRLQRVGIVGQGDGERLVVGRAGCDELRQACSAQQASRHARCKRLAGTSQYRNTEPECIAGGSAGVERQRVEQQIRQCQARKMLCIGQPRRE